MISATPFRLYVTDAYGSVFILDDTGTATQEHGIYGAQGIAIDPLMSKTGLPNLVYGNETLYSRSLLGGADETVLNARGNFMFYTFWKTNHISLASFLWDIGKQNRPRCDAAERGVPQNAASHLRLFCLLT